MSWFDILKRTILEKPEEIVQVKVNTDQLQNVCCEEIRLKFLQKLEETLQYSKEQFKEFWAHRSANNRTLWDFRDEIKEHIIDIEEMTCEELRHDLRMDDWPPKTSGYRKFAEELLRDWEECENELV